MDRPLSDNLTSGANDKSHLKLFRKPLKAFVIDDPFKKKCYPLKRFYLQITFLDKAWRCPHPQITFQCDWKHFQRNVKFYNTYKNFNPFVRKTLKFYKYNTFSFLFKGGFSWRDTKKAIDDIFHQEKVKTQREGKLIHGNKLCYRDLNRHFSLFFHYAI